MRILKWIVVIGLAFLLIAYARSRPTHDFVEYWASAHELVAGRNPYSLARMFQLERPLGWEMPVPDMNLTPPWAMPLVAAFGLAKSYAFAWLVWIGILTAVIWCSTRLLLDFYSGESRIFPKEPRWREPILAFTFFPTIACLSFAQITPFVLLGITGFLWFDGRKRYALAGMCLAVAAIKPHLVYLIWLAVLLRSWQTKKWGAVLGAASTISVLSVIALSLRPRIFADYWALSRSGYTVVWPCAIGGLLRYPLATVRLFELQFVAPLLGAIWFLFYWHRNRGGWNWKKQMPVLITASVLTTAYGWTFDEVLLMVPIVAIAAHYTSVEGRIPPVLVRVYTVLNIVICLMLVLTRLPFILAPVTIAVVLTLEDAQWRDRWGRLFVRRPEPV
jgi:Glycosyltransferase family 87